MYKVPRRLRDLGEGRWRRRTFLDFNTAVNSLGYEVHIRGRDGVEYREGDETIRPSSEPLVRALDFVVWKTSLNRQGYSDARRDEVVERIRAGLAYLGYQLDIDY